MYLHNIIPCHCRSLWHMIGVRACSSFRKLLSMHLCDLGKYDYISVAVIWSQIDFIVRRGKCMIRKRFDGLSAIIEVSLQLSTISHAVQLRKFMPQYCTEPSRVDCSYNQKCTTCPILRLNTRHNWKCSTSHTMRGRIMQQFVARITCINHKLPCCSTFTTDKKAPWYQDERLKVRFGIPVADYRPQQDDLVPRSNERHLQSCGGKIAMDVAVKSRSWKRTRNRSRAVVALTTSCGQSVQWEIIEPMSRIHGLLSVTCQVDYPGMSMLVFENPSHKLTTVPNMLHCCGLS